MFSNEIFFEQVLNTDKVYAEMANEVVCYTKSYEHF